MFSVYRASDDMPVIIYATAKKCADAMGISVGSFYKYLMFDRKGLYRSKKWLIFEDEKTEVEI
jgi:hypothetical protein